MTAAMVTAMAMTLAVPAAVVVADAIAVGISVAAARTILMPVARTVGTVSYTHLTLPTT